MQCPRFPLEMMSEKQAQKFHTYDMSLLRYGLCFWLVKMNFPTRHDQSKALRRATCLKKRAWYKPSVKLLPPIFFLDHFHLNMSVSFEQLGPVVRTLITANPGLTQVSSFFFLLPKSIFWIIFSIFFDHPITNFSKKQLNWDFCLSFHIWIQISH